MRPSHHLSDPWKPVDETVAVYMASCCMAIMIDVIDSALAVKVRKNKGGLSVAR